MKQEEYFGVGTAGNLERILSDKNVKRIFLVTGKKSFGNNTKLKEIFDKISRNYDVLRFNDFEIGDDIKVIEKGVAEFNKFDSEIVIAAGGGKVMDTAKLINIFSANTGDVSLYIKGEKKISNSGKQLIVLPTTAGSGSEATHFAVMYAGKEKFSVANEFMLPDISIVDPQLTFGMPKDIAATSGIDALCQATESNWSVNSTGESKKYSSEAISLILNNLKSSVLTGGENFRVNMSRAANLAGKAINITKTTAPHALSYSMTSYFGIPHGQAVSITLGEFLKFNYGVNETDVTDKRGAEFVKNSIEEIVNLFGSKNVIETAAEISRLMKDIGLKTSLRELGVKSDSDLKIIEENVNYERLENNPRTVTKEAVRRIIGNIL